VERLIEDLETYAHISVVTENNGPNYPLVGQYRARIKDKEHYGFDRNGSAIWITLDAGMEAMVSIDEIISLKVM
jgi:hypothetical protein